jgi:hypothetical protein
MGFFRIFTVQYSKKSEKQAKILYKLHNQAVDDGVIL